MKLFEFVKPHMHRYCMHDIQQRAVKDRWKVEEIFVNQSYLIKNRATYHCIYKCIVFWVFLTYFNHLDQKSIDISRKQRWKWKQISMYRKLIYRWFTSSSNKNRFRQLFVLYSILYKFGKPYNCEDIRLSITKNMSNKSSRLGNFACKRLATNETILEHSLTKDGPKISLLALSIQLCKYIPWLIAGGVTVIQVSLCFVYPCTHITRDISTFCRDT